MRMRGSVWNVTKKKRGQADICSKLIIQRKENSKWKIEGVDKLFHLPIIPMRIIPLILAFFLLAAHFLRSGNIILMTLSVLVPLLLLFKKYWILLLVRWLAYLGALVWVHTTLILVQQRIMAGVPWARMFLILSGVTVFTLYSGHLLNSDIVKRRYQ
jgi:hypothetical protein